ncbi:WGR domain protein [Leptospira santarosai str. CBC379]|uniref:WGR domain protein n=1 Tax=Leptospira santarosai str. MOR084 TaxID=1049984 RepID=A0A0E2BJW9_9LEPT|nr:WGR domain-containing protein [Leptospira santarosai]EKO35287.1 WGR domain protein [Leptospira santarosai str. MOR084]EKR93458.1 WGR domain protein [Leptospira santarosai str. CBC379]
MKHHLTYKDDKSDKFWNIEVDGTFFTVTYGKTGTAGQTQTKSFDDEQKCLKEAEKLLSEKLKKGYLEVGIEKNDSSNKKEEIVESKNAYLEEWETLIKAQDLPKALVQHFSYLIDYPGYDRLLEAVMQKASNVRIEENTLQILFSDDYLLSASPPSSSPEEFSEWPESFRKLTEVHEFIEFGSSAPYIARDLVLGDHGSFLDEYINDETFENAESPLIYNQSDWWIYHPEEKNEHGQSMLYRVSHENGNVKESFPHNIGSLFLKRIADCLEIDKSFYPKSESNDTNSPDLLKEILLPFYILKAEIIGKFRMAAVLSQDGQRFFGILDTSNPNEIKLIGKTEFPSSLDHFNMKVSGSKAILFNRMTSLLNPLVWIDLNDLTSPQVGGIIDEKGSEAAAIHQNQVVYKTNQLFEQNLLNGEKRTFQSLIRAKELLIDENVIIVQNQNEVQVLDRQYNLISQGKVDACFPKSILFPKFKSIVCLDDSFQILNFGTKKLYKQRIHSLNGHSSRQACFVLNDTVWFTTSSKSGNVVQYTLVRLDVDGNENNTVLYPLQEDLEYDERTIEIVSDEIKIYLRNKILIYRLG